MMHCFRFPDLLEADLDELAGEGDGALARHVRSCARCRAAADEILAATQGLAGVLADALRDAPTLPVAPTPHAEAPNPRPRSRRASRPRRLLRTARWAGPLAAAVMAAVVLLPEREPALPGQPLEPPPPTPYVVETPPGRNVAVIATDDPDITVLWLFQGASR